MWYTRDGDIAIVNEVSATYFFSGRHDTRSGAIEADAGQGDAAYSIRLADGRTVRRAGPPACVMRPSVTLVVEDANREKLDEVALLWRLDSPRTMRASECSIKHGPLPQQRVVVIDPKLLALDDGTFLASDARLGLVLRLNDSLKTEGAPGQLALMPVAVLKTMIRAYDRNPEQGGFDWSGFQRAVEDWYDNNDPATGGQS